MANQTIKLNDLSPEQLRAQIKLCFKFMEQCLSMLNGEDVPDEAAIKLVDPTGDCADMELFYACKKAGGAGELSDALETISRLQKQNEKLKKRLAKKHDEIEALKEKPGTVCYKIVIDLDEFRSKATKAAEIMKEIADFSVRSLPFTASEEMRKQYHALIKDLVRSIPGAVSAAIAKKVVTAEKTATNPMRVRGVSEETAKALNEQIEQIRKNVDSLVLRDYLAVKPFRIFPVEISPRFDMLDSMRSLLHSFSQKILIPKYKIGDKVFFLCQNVVKVGKIKGNGIRDDRGIYYHVVSSDDVYKYREEDLFASVDSLLANLKKQVNGEGK